MTSNPIRHPRRDVQHPMQAVAFAARRPRATVLASICCMMLCSQPSMSFFTGSPFTREHACRSHRNHLSSKSFQALASPQDILDNPSNKTQDAPSPSVDSEPSKLPLQVLNQKLAVMSDLCSDPSKPVVRNAIACENLWREQKELAKRLGDESEPNSKSFNTVLRAWAQVSQALSEQHKKHLEIDPASLDPNLPIYIARDAAEHARNLVMEVRDEDYPHLDQVAYNIVMDAFVKSRAQDSPQQCETLLQELQEDERLDPDTFSYNSVFDAYTHSTRTDRLDRLHQLWTEMDASENTQPNLRTLNHLLHAYARFMTEAHEDERRIYADRAHNLFRRFQKKQAELAAGESHVDLVSYTTLIDIFGRVETQEATEKAEELFRELKDVAADSSNSIQKPNTYTYVSLMSAWARVARKVEKNEAVQRVENLLEELLADPSVLPNSRPFSAVLQCYSRPSTAESSAKAVALLQRMRKLQSQYPEVAPTIVTYNTAIECCGYQRASAEEKNASLQRAFAIFKALKKDKKVDPNPSTFCSLLKVSGFLLPVGSDERHSVAKAVWEQAVAAGQVDRKVIQHLQRAVDSQVWRELLGDSFFTEKDAKMSALRIVNADIPLAWRKNVKY